MIWTVFFTTACLDTDGITHQSIGAEEFFGPHDIGAAREVASEFGTTILAMVPGSHVNKAYLFDRGYEYGRRPIQYHAVCGKTTAS